MNKSKCFIPLIAVSIIILSGCSSSIPELNYTPVKQTQPIFDPETGEAIIETQFDPETGEQIAVAEEKQKMSYGEIVKLAKNAARSRHNRGIYNAAGIASCIIYPIGLPVAILYTESGVASNMNPYDTAYLDLDSSQKIQYKNAYKQEEKQLRRKSIYGAEGFCVGLLFFMMMADG